MLKRILGIVGWIGIGLVVAGVLVRWFRPDLARLVFWLPVAGLVCILLYLASDWRSIGQFFAGRRARLGTAAVTSTLVVLGILVAVNYIGNRESKRWDLTSSKEYTLSEQTQKVLGKLDAPLKMIVFARQAEFDRYRTHLDEYQSASRKVSIEYVDPDKNPTLARQYQIQTYGTIALSYKTRTERAVSDSEQDLANAIIKVITGEQKKVYFVQGHAEHDTGSSERAGYSNIASALGRDNYSVDKLVLAQQNDVPADASVVVIAGPKVDLLAPEVEMLRRYLQKGGKVLLMLDPPDKADSPPLTNLLTLARDWDVQVNNDVVVDVSGIGQLLGTDATVPVAAPPYPASAITDQFQLLTAFPLARSVTPISGGVNGHNAQTFVQTSGASWSTDAQRVMTSRQIGKFDESKGDKKGPVSIAAFVSGTAAEPQPAASPAKNDKTEQKGKSETRLAVFGDSDFAANYALGIQGNKDLFMNTVSWLAQQENLISIRPKEPEDRRVTLTAAQQSLTLLLALGIIPGLIIVSGVYTWWRRR